MTMLVVLVGLIALAWEGALAVAFRGAHGRGDGDGSDAGVRQDQCSYHKMRRAVV